MRPSPHHWRLGLIRMKIVKSCNQITKYVKLIFILWNAKNCLSILITTNFWSKTLTALARQQVEWACHSFSMPIYFLYHELFRNSNPIGFGSLCYLKKEVVMSDSWLWGTKIKLSVISLCIILCLLSYLRRAKSSSWFMNGFFIIWEAWFKGIHHLLFSFSFCGMLKASSRMFQIYMENWRGVKSDDLLASHLLSAKNPLLFCNAKLITCDNISLVWGT